MFLDFELVSQSQVNNKNNKVKTLIPYKELHLGKKKKKSTCLFTIICSCACISIKLQLLVHQGLITVNYICNCVLHYTYSPFNIVLYLADRLFSCLSRFFL